MWWWVSSHALAELQQWYAAQCDGDWEHSCGIRIGTLDNPGWRVDIHLTETRLETLPFDAVEAERSETDWIHASVRDSVFIGRGGPGNLEEILELFVRWSRI